MDKIIYPENQDQAKALLQFLVNEKHRYHIDIEQIEADLVILEYRWHLKRPKVNHTFMKP